MKNLLPLLLLAACAARPETVFAPVPVDMPVPAMCAAPEVAPPPDLTGGLPRTASLTEFVQTCAAQTALDKASLLRLQAALEACRK